MDPQIYEISRAVVAPGLTGAVLLGVLWRPWRRHARDERTALAPPPPAPPGWMTGLTLGAAFVASMLIAQGYHGLWPTDTTRRLLWAPVLGLLVTGVGWAGLRFGVRWLGALGVLLGAFALAWSLAEHRRRNGWSGTEIPIWTGLWTLAIACGWNALVWSAARRPGPWIALTLSAACAALGLVLKNAGIGSLGQLAGVLSAWLGFSFLLGLWNRSFTLSGAAAHVLAACVSGLVTLGYTTAPEPSPRIGLGLIVLTIAVIAPGALLAQRTRENEIPWRRLLVDGVVVVLFAGASAITSVPPPVEDEDDGLSDLYQSF